MTSLSRRRFMAISSAAACGAAFFQIPSILRAANLAKKNDPFHGLPVGVQSYSLRKFNTLEAVRHIQGMGLHFVEFFSKHLSPTATDDQIAETKELLSQADIRMSSHGVNGFSSDHAANRRIFEFAKRAGLKNITANPTPDAFDSLDKLCAEFDIRIAIHNHGPGALYDSIDSVKQAVQGRHKNIGACCDTGHFIRSGEDPVKAVRELGQRVFGLHLKDDKFKGDKRSHNVVLGQANLDVVGIIKALKEVNFPADGSISLEYESNPDNPIDDMKQCITVVKDAFARVATS